MKCVAPSRGGAKQWLTTVWSAQSTDVDVSDVGSVAAWPGCGVWVKGSIHNTQRYPTGYATDMHEYANVYARIRYLPQLKVFHVGQPFGLVDNLDDLAAARLRVFRHVQPHQQPAVVAGRAIIVLEVDVVLIWIEAWSLRTTCAALDLALNSPSRTDRWLFEASRKHHQRLAATECSQNPLRVVIAEIGPHRLKQQSPLAAPAARRPLIDSKTDLRTIDREGHYQNWCSAVVRWRELGTIEYIV